MQAEVCSASAGLSGSAQICIAVFSTLAGVMVIVAVTWVHVSKRLGRMQSTSRIEMFSRGHGGSMGVRLGSVRCWHLLAMVISWMTEIHEPPKVSQDYVLFQVVAYSGLAVAPP